MSTFACVSPSDEPEADEGEELATTTTATQEIIGGTQATPGEFPWQVQLQVTGYSHWCGGSVVDTEWVLTAAHCVSGMSPGNITVRAGLHQRTMPDANTQTRSVSHIVQHPAYNGGTIENDLALIKLSAPLVYTARVQPISIRPTDAPVNTLATVSGWGQTAASPSPSPDFLMKAQLPVRSTLTCNNAGTLPLTVQDSMVCAGYVNGTSGGCHGDSGGPLSVPKAGGGWEQIGIVSWGVGGSCSSYTVFSRLSQFAEWIQSTISPTYTALALQNGWTHAPFATRSAAVGLVSDIVQLKGAIANGTSAVAFTLPAQFRPTTMVYVPVDLCNAKKGRLIIQPTGVVSIQAEVAFSDAQCFTSLEGASFARSPAGFTTLSLQNGWTHAPFSTSNAQAVKLGGIVHLKGAIASGTTGQAFTLPAALRPATSVYVPIDLCTAKKGRLYIQPSGVATVIAADSFADAQCFTSLDGAKFAQDGGPFTALSLQNGWTHAPFSTGTAGVEQLSGVVRFKGAIGSGTTGQAFTLPAQLRPATNVYVPIDLCNAQRGRLVIQSNGVVTVYAENLFGDAQCFTSLDGASFAL